MGVVFQTFLKRMRNTQQRSYASLPCIGSQQKL